MNRLYTIIQSILRDGFGCELVGDLLGLYHGECGLWEAREGEQAGERAAASDAPATRPDEPATIQPTPGGRPCYADLSSDVWLVLLEHHLDTRSLCAIARTCSFLAELTSSRRLWAGQFLRMFGDRNGSLLTNRYESAGADALS